MAQRRERDTFSNMVKVVDGGAWRAGVLVALLGVVGASNACGGRTVWLEEEAGGGDSGSGGVSGYGGGGDAGAYGGDYGTGGYTGGYGGTYVGGAYGGGGYTGGVAGKGGAYGGGGYTGGVAGKGGYGGTYVGGAYGGGGYTGGVAGKGGYGGAAGVTATGGCGAVSGTGGSAGSPGLSKSCSLFCTRFPYASCPSDFDGAQDCLTQCRDGFGISPWCQDALTDFLVCTGQALNPNAMCVSTGGGSCSGPGCLEDALIKCADSYLALIECESTPRPIPPCPPPDRPLPPNCGQGYGVGPDSCMRETSCPGMYQTTECYYQYDAGGFWACNCLVNGNLFTSVSLSSSADPCASAAATCGFY
jgi:hypothetical protein